MIERDNTDLTTRHVSTREVAMVVAFKLSLGETSQTGSAARGRFAFLLPPTMANIWIAASDGDLGRVSELVESGISPNAFDENTYTPIHAAASYGHIDVLELLLLHGGDLNIADDDGDTPIYVVENVDTARWLLGHGAVIDRVNKEGVSPIQAIEEDWPLVADFLKAEIELSKMD